MKILFFGDVIGRAGREGLLRVFLKLKEQHRPDFVVVNAENAAHGRGLTPKIAQELWAMGVNVLTMGNHTFDKKDILPLMDDPRMIRPANYPAAVPGHGYGIFQTASGASVAVLQLMGRIYMPLTDCPFQLADKVLPELRTKTKVILVDVHAEITAEKAAMAWHLDGRVSAVLGTHTHVQTADERVLPGGTAFLTDAGACGPLNGIIGADVKAATHRFLTGLHVPLSVAEGDAMICGCAIDIDENTGHARSIERIRELVSLPATLSEDK